MKIWRKDGNGVTRPAIGPEHNILPLSFLNGWLCKVSKLQNLLVCQITFWHIRWVMLQSKKSLPIFIVCSPYAKGQDFFNILYICFNTIIEYILGFLLNF